MTCLEFFPRSNNAEGGSDGVTPTVANSGGASGDAWDGVTAGAGESLQYDDDGHQLNTMSYRLEKTDSSSGAFRLTWGPVTTPAPLLVARLSIYRTAHPPDRGAGQSPFRYIIQMGEWSGPDGASLGIQPDTGFFNIHNFQGDDTATGTVAMPLDQWVSFELEIEFLEAAGVVRGRMYDADGCTLLESLEITGVRTGGDDIEKFATYGWSNSVVLDRDNENVPWWIDNINICPDCAPDKFKYGWGVNMNAGVGV